MNRLLSYLSAPILILSLSTIAMSPLESVAQNLTNGYVCAPKNIGGEETRLYFRQQDGVAENLSKSATFPVVCPIVIQYDNQPYFVVVTVGHSSDVDQKFSCSLEEYTGNAVKVRGIGKSEIIAPGASTVMTWENIYLQDPTNYLSLRCILPPRGGIGGLAYF